jgi:hypothetical protein
MDQWGNAPDISSSRMAGFPSGEKTHGPSSAEPTAPEPHAEGQSGKAPAAGSSAQRSLQDGDGRIGRFGARKPPKQDLDAFIRRLEALKQMGPPSKRSFPSEP